MSALWALTLPALMGAGFGLLAWMIQQAVVRGAKRGEDEDRARKQLHDEVRKSDQRIQLLAQQNELDHLAVRDRVDALGHEVRGVSTVLGEVRVDVAALRERHKALDDKVDEHLQGEQ